MSRISSQVPGAVVHWDSSNLSSLTISSANISSWQSLTGTYALTPSGSNPTFGTDVHGNYVNFTKSSAFICHDLAATLSGDNTLMMVAVYTDTANNGKNNQIIRTWTKNKDDNHSVYVPNTKGQLQVYRRDRDSTQSQMILDDWYSSDILIAGYDDSEILNRIETLRSERPGLVVHDDWTLLFDRFSVGPWTGRLRELAIFTGSLSTTDKSEIVTDLALKWQIARTLGGIGTAAGTSTAAAVAMVTTGSAGGSATATGVGGYIIGAVGTAAGSSSAWASGSAA